MRLRRSTRFLLPIAAATLALLTGGTLAAGDSSAATGKVITGNAFTLKIRSAPNASAPIVGELHNGTKITFDCQTTGSAVRGDYGTSNLWDRIPGRGYVADAWVYTGSNGRVAPQCSTKTAPQAAPKAAPKTSNTARKRGATRASNPLAAYRGYCTWGAQEKIRQAAGYYVSALTGNANQWDNQARAAGWTVVSDAQPRSVVVFESNVGGASSYGHVAWVNSVENRRDGRYIHLTEMNWGRITDSYNAITTNFNKFTTRTVKDIPGMSYILIP